VNLDPVIQLKHISKTFPGVKALDDVQFSVNKGEVHALIGENGAGKSTLIKILAGVEVPDHGFKFLFEGQPVNIKQPIDATRLGISVIYQDLSLFPNLSVAENIAIGRDQSGGFSKVPWKSIHEIARSAIAELGIDIDVRQPLEQLSIAKQQLVAIARALAFQAKLIIMDEPTSSLSEGEVENLYRVIRGLKDKGIAIVFVSHKLKELFTVSDRFTVLRDGKYVGTYDAKELNEEKLIALMVGRKIELEQHERRNRGSLVLEVDRLSKRGNFRDVSFALYQGEIVGVTGLVGSGRTELAQALFGLNTPDSGVIRVNGQEVRVRNSTDAVKLGFAYVPESRQRQGLILRQSIINNVSISILNKLRNKLGLISRKKEVDLAKEYGFKLDIRPAIPEMTVGKLSGGNQQKVVIAKWLATNPNVLIIDEPTNGIDIGAKTEIHRLLRSLADQGMAILMISSELPEILNVSDRILVMRKGRIVAEMNTKTATQESIMNYALLGQQLDANTEQTAKLAADPLSYKAMSEF
jgi:ABC-type sugar transport system ATPase subunit